MGERDGARSKTKKFKGIDRELIYKEHLQKFPPRKIVNPAIELAKETERFQQARKDTFKKYALLSA